MHGDLSLVAMLKCLDSEQQQQQQQHKSVFFVLPSKVKYFEFEIISFSLNYNMKS